MENFTIVIIVQFGRNGNGFSLRHISISFLFGSYSSYCCCLEFSFVLLASLANCSSKYSRAPPPSSSSPPLSHSFFLCLAHLFYPFHSLLLVHGTRNVYTSRSFSKTLIIYGAIFIRRLFLVLLSVDVVCLVSEEIPMHNTTLFVYTLTPSFVYCSLLLSP